MISNEFTLSDISTIVMGTSPKGDTYNSDGVGMPLLNGPTEFGLFYPNCTLFTTDSRKECKPGDLIFCVRGSTTGRMNWADRPYSLGRGVCVIRGESLLDTRYIKYVLDEKLKELLNLAGGGTFPNLTKGTIYSFRIPYPIHRHKIAAILSAYDDLIENNTRRIQIQEKIAQAIYREWFVNFRFPGHENVRMVDSGTELGDVPEGWVVGSFTNYIDVLSGGTPKTRVPEYWNGNIPWFTPKDLGKSFFVFDTERKITELGLSKCNSKLYPANTVFITARGTVGKCVLSANPMAISQTNYALLGLEIMSQYYIYLMTLDKVDILRKQATGAVFDTIIVDTFRKLNIFVPDKSIIEEFDKVVAPIFELIKTLSAKNTNLHNTRDLLLPKLVSEQVDVTQLEISV